MKILIADDEIQIRLGLSEGIPWESLGFEKIYTAENGIQALEVCKDYQPEVVITDIQMPGMSGLELGKEIKKLYQPVEVIILSGYSEFEYARDAITIRAFDYLLKPIRINELIERVEGAKLKVEQYHKEHKIQNEFQVINRTRTLQQMIMSKQLLNADDEKKLLELTQITSSKHIMLGICSVDTLVEKESDQLGRYLEKCMHEILSKYEAQELYRERGNLIFAMSVFSENDRKRRLVALKEDMTECNNIWKTQYHNTVSMAVSNIGEIKELAILFGDTENLLKKRMYCGGAVFLEQGTDKESTKIVLNPINLVELKKRIECFDYGHVHLYLREVFKELKDQKVTSEDFVKSLCEQLKNLLLQTMSDKGIDIEGIFERNQVLLNEIPDYFTLDEYEEWVDTLYQLILQGLSQLSGKQHSRMILQAVDFISKNYAENINLEMTAQHVNKSKNYFSYLFKKELGISFVEYLNQVRVEAAKKLLDTTDERTYEISEKVGYSDYKYFSSVFKKNTGMSPVHYKKRDKS